MIRTTREQRTASRRSGVVLLVALALLAVFSLLLAAMLRQVVTGIRQTRQANHQHQSTWLANAGLERAAFRIRTENGYTGERWRILPEQMATDPSQTNTDSSSSNSPVAIVVIEVTSGSDRDNSRQVVVTADYPTVGTARVRTRKSMVLELTPEE